MFILEVTDGPRKGERIKLREEKPVLFGRKEASAFAIPSDAMMSGSHFTAVGNLNVCVITDEGSSNGTYVDGMRIDSVQVSPGQRIRAGKSEFLVTYTPSFGNWLIPAIPQGWAEVPGRGLQADQPGRFPTNILFVEEEEPIEIPLTEYVERQQVIARELLPEAKFAPAQPVKLPDVEEAIALQGQFTGVNGVIALQRQVYVLKFGIAGAITVTTIQQEMPAVEPMFNAVVAKAVFDPEMPPPAEADPS
jgi:pSer/pThr/pTyr-binding forkhead associated (FHA) protein